MSTRSLLSVVLLIWLVLSLTRLTFDLIGKLWIVAVFDLVQIVFCITGAFGSIQKRICLLYALLVSNILSITQNVLIFLWYIGMFGEISRPVLSAGLPYSFSFFLRFTPACQSHFDLKRSIWVQHHCIVPFYTIEAAQSLTHIFFAIFTTFFSIMLINELKQDEKDKMMTSSHKISNTYSQIRSVQQQLKSNQRTSSINDSSSGYMNSTYEELRSQRSSIKKTPSNTQFERNSKRKRGSKPRPSSMPAPDSAPCTSSSKSSENEDVYTKPIKRVHQKYEEDVEDQPARPPTVTSLVSFDPKSATLMKIRQHLELEANDDNSDAIYERLRCQSSDSDQQQATTSAPMPINGYKHLNASQDSVPSICAPMLSSNERKTLGTSPGIRLTDQIGKSSPPSSTYKSAFRVQSADHRIIGHYHAPNEIPLSSAPTISSDREDDLSTTTSNFPVLTSSGLLV